VTHRASRRPAAFPVATLVQALSGLLVLSLHAQVRAQEVGPAQDVVEVETPVSPPPPIWVTPRLSISQGFSNNGGLTSQNSQSEQITEVSPGIGVVFNKPRLKGFFDYSLRAIYDARNTVGDNLQQSLNTNGTFEAWDNRAFIDFAGLIGQQPISAFETPSVDALGNDNLSETSSFRLSPYLRGSLPSSVDYELRYTWATTRTDTTLRSDITTEEGLARLSRQATGQSIGWSLEGSRTRLDYSFGQVQTLDAVNGRVFYAVNPTLTLSALVGVESNDLLTPDMKSYRSTGLGFEWRPSERTRVYAERSNRYFGDGHNLEIEYRSRRSVWRYTDTRDVVTSQLDARAASMGSLYGLIDALSTEPDPVRRAQQVNAELQRLGLPANLQLNPGYLTSSASVQRLQELSLGLFAPRDAFVVAVARNSGRRLNPVINLSDDFVMASDILEKAWRVTYAHRVTPLTSVNTSYTRQNNVGINTSFSNTLKTLTFGVSTRLAVRTSASVQVRHSDYSGTAPYKETAVLGVVTHRF
jgi:uncharacterized protein (PEP-CTERM system associated)